MMRLYRSVLVWDSCGLDLIRPRIRPSTAGKVRWGTRSCVEDNYFFLSQGQNGLQVGAMLMNV
jgi:hypothetical protein